MVESQPNSLEPTLSREPTRGLGEPERLESLFGPPSRHWIFLFMYFESLHFPIIGLYQSSKLEVWRGDEILHHEIDRLFSRTFEIS